MAPHTSLQRGTQQSSIQPFGGHLGLHPRGHTAIVFVNLRGNGKSVCVCLVSMHTLLPTHNCVHGGVCLLPERPYRFDTKRTHTQPKTSNLPIKECNRPGGPCQAVPTFLFSVSEERRNGISHVTVGQGRVNGTRLICVCVCFLYSCRGLFHRTLPV